MCSTAKNLPGPSLHIAKTYTRMKRPDPVWPDNGGTGCNCAVGNIRATGSLSFSFSAASIAGLNRCRWWAGRLRGLLWEWKFVIAPATRGLAGSGSHHKPPGTPFWGKVKALVGGGGVGMLVACNVCLFCSVKMTHSHVNAKNKADQNHSSHTLGVVPSENRRTAWLWVTEAPSLSISQSKAPPTSIFPRSRRVILPPYPLSVWHHRHICRPNTVLVTQAGSKNEQSTVPLALSFISFQHLSQKRSAPGSSLATLYPVAVWANLSIPTTPQQILTGRKQPFN